MLLMMLVPPSGGCILVGDVSCTPDAAKIHYVAHQHPPTTTVTQAGGVASGPSPHSIVVHELQILDTSRRGAGRVLGARRLRAAHCLTSLQVSPAGQLLLVAYGRRHISLVRSLLEGSSIIPVHTVLEVCSAFL